MGAPPKSMAITAAMVAMVTGHALAQQEPASPVPPRISVQGPAVMPQAPVGHRQPTLSDLPPDLAREQRSGLSKPEPTESGEPTTTASRKGKPNTPSRGMIDEWLRICRGC